MISRCDDSVFDQLQVSVLRSSMLAVLKLAGVYTLCAFKSSESFSAGLLSEVFSFQV
jgi:hypothetical protein